MVECEIESSEVTEDEAIDTEKFAANLTLEMDAAMVAAAELIREELFNITPKRTGVTAASWGVMALGLDEYYIWNENEPIATFLSEGTQAHWVEPVNAQALHWVEGEVDYFSKGHWVSGIEAMDLEETALENVDDQIEALVDAAIDSANRES